jgi:hypothetical protein
MAVIGAPQAVSVVLAAQREDTSAVALAALRPASGLLRAGVRR